MISLSYKLLPEIIPSHFDFTGKVDKSASKLMLWVLPILSLGVYLLLITVNKYPHSHNYRVKITKENAEREYVRSIELGAYINLVTTVLLLIVSLTIIVTAFNSNSNIGTFLIPITVLYLIIIIRKSFSNNTKTQ